VRKTVTILFADVVGSTALGESRDPERIRAQMGRWFDATRATIEAHGGTVEKFAGDSVMAVFGVPTSHEDDALRAVRAAAELRSPELRIGVNTGEVVAGDGEALVTGDAVNVAARLEQEAAPGEVLIGAETERLVRAAADVTHVPPLDLKGKSSPVEAYQLIGVREGAEGIARRLGGVLVGREGELALLHQAFDRAVSERSCQFFTLLGTAGVGKSRLAAEFLAAAAARVVRGRCLSYGEGITYFPLVEVLFQLDVDPDDVVKASPPETQLAFRKLLEREAAARPVIVVFDDIQWAEPTLLDLIEHVADLSRGASIFLLCIARPDLLDVRPTWGGGKLNATSVLLEPLSQDDCEELIATLGGAKDETRLEIVRASGGNPLFVEEMLAMLRDEGEVAVPPTIHALLQARLDTLRSEERAVVERGAVEGEVFHRGSVVQLAPEADVDAQLPSLVRKELIRPDVPVFPEDDAYRFRHLLIRDAAYEALPKELRAELHERFALWLEEHTELVERDEIVGYHFEQAYQYRTELDETDSRRAPLSERGAAHLSAAGRAALGRADYRGGINLLERASALVPPGSEKRLFLLAELGPAMVGTGRFEDASACARELAASSKAYWRAQALLVEMGVGYLTGYPRPIDELLGELARSIEVFEAHSDDLGIARAYAVQAEQAWAQCQALESAEKIRKALAHAERARDRGLIQALREELVMTYPQGPTPADEASAELEAILEQSAGLLQVEAAARRALGRIAAMRGDFEAGRELFRSGREPLAEMGLAVAYAAVGQGIAFIERLAGDLAAEEDELLQNLEALEKFDERGFSSTAAVLLAGCLAEQGRDAEAEHFVRITRERTPEDDLTNFITADAVEAVLKARRGEHAEAECLALRAVERAETTDFWETRGRSLESLAATYAAAGRRDDAREAYARALEIYKEKGATVVAARGRALIAEL
jgi:class 3 adenylate cyclase/tetratricopeptide (TPR) repeat protein